MSNGPFGGNIFKKVEVRAGGCEVYYPPDVDKTSTTYANDVKRYGKNVHILNQPVVPIKSYRLQRERTSPVGFSEAN